MHLGRAAFAAVLAIAIQSGEANAQGAPSTQLQTFMATGFYKGLLGKAFSGIHEVVFKKCPTLVSKNSNILVVKPVTFGTSGYPNAGLWKYSFPVSGCGNDTVLNFYLSAGADEKINTTVALPGTTRADPILQRDALLFANTGASVAAKDCKSFIVKNTRFDGFGTLKSPSEGTGPDKQSGPWRETWTLFGCGRSLNVPMDFIPNSRGTSIVQPGHVTLL